MRALLARPRLTPLRCSSRRARQTRASKLQVASGEREAEEGGNQALARRILSLLGGDAVAFRELQAQTSRYRAGHISAGELQQRFHGALGAVARGDDGILASVAGLMPPGRTRAALLAAARGDDGAASGAVDDDCWVAKPLAKPTDAALDSLARATAAAEPPATAAGPPDGGARPKQSRRVKPKLAADEPRAAKGQNVLLWLRSDLRLHDNPALDAAARKAQLLGGKLALCYVHSPEEDGDDITSGTSWRPAGASLVWQQAGLQAFDADLQAKFGPGAGIVFLRGPYAPALIQAARALGAGALFFSRRYEPAMQAADARVEAALRAERLEVRSLGAALLHEPAAVQLSLKGRWVGHFGTLSPFLRACDRLGSAGKPLPAPQRLPVGAAPPAQAAGGLPLEQLGLVRLPRRRDGSLVRWDASLLQAWQVSEAAALDALDEFAASRLPAYEASRHLADGRAVSALSPYLRHGQLSPRQVLAVASAHGGPQASKTFWRRLVWRDLAYWQLHHWPAMAAQPMRPHYAAQEWREDPAALEAWRRGRTGFPLVDAGMRQLWATGWMQQSVRMVCALFLTEYLNLHWLHGCRWFHECLVDADLAINSMMWQNAGKSGLDQWNFTLLPTSSSQDPDGSYVARWVPEVAELPKKFRHQPWLAPEAALQAAGLVLGDTYPHRITGDADVRELRKENQRAICEMRAAAGRDCTDGGGYDVIRVPHGATREGDGQTIRIFTKREYRASGVGAREPRAAKA